MSMSPLAMDKDDLMAFHFHCVCSKYNKVTRNFYARSAFQVHHLDAFEVGSSSTNSVIGLKHFIQVSARLST